MPKQGRKAKADAPEQSAQLNRVLDQSEQVQEKVEDAAVDLASVNVVLKTEVHKGTPLTEVIGALDQSIHVEGKMQEAADELVAVNDALVLEIDDRVAVERELVDSQAALAQSLVKERRARHDALHDQVTGLPNAALFKDRLETALVQARRHSWTLAVMFIDLDGFKAVNDQHGHELGDGVLRLVADRMREFVRDGDTVSRRSGDEFLYLMLEAKDVQNARDMAQRLLAIVTAPAVVDGVSVAVQASIGLAMFPADGTSAAALLKHADLAMYGAKPQPG